MLANAQRTGLYINMSLEEFATAKEVNGVWLVYVKGHKSFNTYGSAEVVIEKQTKALIHAYITNFRPVSSCQNVFLNFTGNQMDPSTVINGLINDMADAGIEKR
jgi:hypothetical protein